MVTLASSPQETTVAAASLRRQQAAARLSLGSNCLLVVLKIGAGVFAASVSVLAEGLQSLMDVAASAMILLSIRAAAAPPDRGHPYGHGKLENLASLAQAALILGSAGYLLWAAWQRWQNPVMPRVDWGIAALGTAAAVNAAVSHRLSGVAKDTGSQALAAEALHLRSDLLSCLGVILGLVAVWALREPRLDPLIAAAMAVVVVAAALRLMSNSLRPLLDERLSDEEEGLVRRVLESDPRVRGYHRLRTRRAGSHRLMDLHVLLDDDLTFPQAHAITEEIEAALRSALGAPDVIVHSEPYEAEVRHQRDAHGAPPG